MKHTRTCRIVTSDIFPGDAIGNFCIQASRYLASSGRRCELYARNYSDGNPYRVREFDAVRADCERGDTVLVNFSIYEPGNEMLSSLDARKLVYYHGITPPVYFSDYDARTAEYCERGLRQFPLFRGYDYYLANSAYMLEELRAGVCGGDTGCGAGFAARSASFPPFIAECLQQTAAEPAPVPEGAFPLLYVGRIAPHKCVHELVVILESIRAAGVDASLLVVGASGSDAYLEQIRLMLREGYAGIADRIMIYGHVSNAQLEYLYRNSRAFITMSEHEGFCMPLVEAMQHGLPVIARQGGAIAETLGGSGLLVDGDYVQQAVSYIQALQQGDFYRQTVAGQQRNCSRILESARGERFIRLLESAGA